MWLGPHLATNPGAPFLHEPLHFEGILTPHRLSLLVARRTAPIFVLVASLVLVPVYAGAVGYIPRACGFDLNHDGVIGDAVADCKICNGVDTFPDKDLLYVDCQNGNDSTGTGAPGKPFKTIQHAFDSANGPGNGKADVVCFKGTCHETIVPKQSGIAGSYTRDGFSYPTKPAMLVGWDANDNGIYPPVDTADTAVLDGQNTLGMAINNTNALGYLELAHFVAQNYGTPGTPIPEGFMHVAMNVGSPNNVYVHDLSLRNIDRGQNLTSDTIVFNMFIGNAVLTNFAVENLESLDSGGYFVRGASSVSTVTGPYRFKNLTVKAHGANNDSSTGFKLWGATTGIEVAQSLFDCNTSAWTPIANGGQPSYAIAAAQCTRSWNIHDNTFLNWKMVLEVQPDAGTAFCTSRMMDDVVFDRNIIRNTYAPWQFGNNPITIEAGTTNANTTVANVTIRNNILSSTTGWQMCIWSDAGNNAAVNPGTISILNNTCVMDVNRWAGIVIGNPTGGSNPTFPQQNYVVKNNVVVGLKAGEVAVNTGYRPTNLAMDGNIYDPAASYSWNNACANCATAGTLAAWRTQSGQDAHSRACAPAFVSASTGDYHLKSTDTCARGAAVAAASSTTTDIDGESRPASGAWDAGADQVNGGPAAPQLIDVTPVP